jgi:heme/copper-type cytochrome/quinol oxidase subunit 2
MIAEDTVFSVLYDKFMFWSDIVGIITFGVLFYSILRYRAKPGSEEFNPDHIEVGTFPVDRHNTRLEIAFYVVPTILIVWLTVLATSSSSVVWDIPADEESFDVNIVGKQWFWEFDYVEELTWQDDSRITNVNVDWKFGSTTLTINTLGSSAVNATVVQDGGAIDYAIDLESNSTIIDLTSNYYIYQSVKVTDADGNLLHTWEHLPVDHKLSTAAGEHFVIPCDEPIVLTMFSRPHDQSNPAYVGVQHSFWLPQWGVKEDLVPGLEGGTVMTFEPDRVGTFNIRCAEYCGLNHAKMRGYIDIVARDGETCDEDVGIKLISDSEGSSGGE